MVLGLIGGFQMKDSQGGGVSSRSYRNARVTGDDAKVSPLPKLPRHQVWVREGNASPAHSLSSPSISVSCCL